MALQERLAELEKLGNEVMKIDLGYPLGKNEVRPPVPGASLPDAVNRRLCKRACSELTEFFALCDGFAFANVHVGYFMSPSAQILATGPRSEPSIVLGSPNYQVQPIGSTGAGDLFAVDCTTGSILLLRPAAIEGDRYSPNKGGVSEIGRNFDELLSRITKDVEAFIEDRDHAYLA